MSGSISSHDSGDCDTPTNNSSSQDLQTALDI